MLQWGAGDAGRRTISIQLNADGVSEAALEDFRVSLIGPSAAVSVENSDAQARIIDSLSGAVVADDRECPVAAVTPQPEPSWRPVLCWTMEHENVTGQVRLVRANGIGPFSVHVTGPSGPVVSVILHTWGDAEVTFALKGANNSVVYGDDNADSHMAFTVTKVDCTSPH